MKDRLEQELYNIDFSADTDLKERLAARLFGGQAPGPRLVYSRTGKARAASPLTDDEVEYVTAAMGSAPLPSDDPVRKSGTQKKDPQKQDPSNPLQIIPPFDTDTGI